MTSGLDENCLEVISFYGSWEIFDFVIVSQFFWQPNWCRVSSSHCITRRAGKLYESFWAQSIFLVKNNQKVLDQDWCHLPLKPNYPKSTGGSTSHLQPAVSCQPLLLRRWLGRPLRTHLMNRRRNGVTISTHLQFLCMAPKQTQVEIMSSGQCAPTKCIQKNTKVWIFFSATR